MDERVESNMSTNKIDYIRSFKILKTILPFKCVHFYYSLIANIAKYSFETEFIVIHKVTIFEQLRKEINL